MLGIYGEVAVGPVTVAGEDVAGFVPGLGLAADGQRQLKHQDNQQRYHGGSEKPATRAVGELHGRKVYLRDGRDSQRYVSGEWAR